MSTRKTHLLRAKPPWREGLDHTMCGRKVTGSVKAVPPDAAMAREATAWVYGKRVRPGAKPQPAPDGKCEVCWERLGSYGYEKWDKNPVAVLRIDTAVWDSAGRDALRLELLALASLAAKHPQEFRDLLESEKVLAALG